VRGIVADVNIEGHVARLFDVMHIAGWEDFWRALGLVLETFADLELEAATADSVVWRTCQQEQLILITANRNNDGPDSLEATIQAENTADSLPVLTIGVADEIMVSSDYAKRVVVRLLEILDEIDLYRGTGRLYLP